MITLFLMLISPIAVHATAENDKTLSPYFFIRDSDSGIDQFPLKETHVKVTITGVIADVTVTQIYTNNGPQPVHGAYIFPASTRTAIHGMKMQIGENIITAKVTAKEKASKQFNEAKKAGKSATLLEQKRPNVFKMNVANIMPNDTISIELRYTELIMEDDGVYEFVYPTVVGPRYANQSEAHATESDKWIKNPYLKQGSSVSSRFNITTDLSAGCPIRDLSCHTHEIDTTWQGETMARVNLSNADAFGGNRDYIVQYRLSGQAIQSGLMLYKGPAENFFLLMVHPPEKIDQTDIPPREYIFVVDVSGSMSGFPLNTAKKLMKDLLLNLNPNDTFNVVLFAGSSKVMAPSSLSANPANLQQAIRFIEGQTGGGGTELFQALSSSLALPKVETSSRTVVIVTDGYIDAEKDVFELIRENLCHTNVFAFGIGSSVNRYLIEGMAKAGQGEPFVVTEVDQTRLTVEKFRKYISEPVLTGVTVYFEGVETYDVEPVSIPDVFARRPVRVFGKWRGEQKGKIHICGTNGDKVYHQVFDIEHIQSHETHSAIRYLWARARIARLSDYQQTPDPESEREITSLGLTYNLMTAYTSFIAVLDDIRNPDGQATHVLQPLPLPQNVSNLAVGYANVPEPDLAVLFFLLALMLIVFSGKNISAHIRNKPVQIDSIDTDREVCF